MSTRAPFSLASLRPDRLTARMDEHDFELLTLAQLRQNAGPAPLPCRVHAQVDLHQEKKTSTGSPYLEIKLADAGGSLVWRVFDNNPALAEARELRRGQFIQLSGNWVDGGKYGPEPRHPRLRPLTDDEARDLLKGDRALAERQRQDYAEIEAFMDSLADPRLRGLARLFLEKHGARFHRTAAARENHHARRGGLVEHVAQMMRAAAAIAGVYPMLNRDLLLAGVLFHDCGKLWENCYPESGFAMPYQLHGEMIGHIPLGMELVNKLWRELMDLPEAAEWTALEPASDLARLHLLHLIAAHHGELQYGSPVLPKTPEAVALHYVDNLDAKLEMLRRGYETSTEIGPGILERFRPWATHILEPLAAHTPPAPAPSEEAREETA
ncbi:MAG TPA: hydrolase [Verrucomicrobiales bacterium]|nr:hydrolase [Verrucomicrobiales bacterium]